MRLLLYAAVLGAGLLLAVTVVGNGWGLFQLYRSAPAAPAPVRASEAQDGQWVKLTDLEVRCDTRVEQRGSTFFLATAGDGEAPIAVHLLGDVACDAVTTEGGFLPGRYTRDWLEEKLGVRFPGGDAQGPEVRVFSRTLAPEYQRSALLRLLPMLGLGLLMWFVGARGLFRTIRARSQAGGSARGGRGGP
jgi:hypothetical protein